MNPAEAMRVVDSTRNVRLAPVAPFPLGCLVKTSVGAQLQLGEVY